MTPTANKVIAIDSEVAAMIASMCFPGEGPNACLRRLLDLPPRDNARHSNWRDKYLRKEVKP